MAVQNKVSLPVIKRLPKYYRYLTNLSADGKDKIHRLFPCECHALHDLFDRGIGHDARVLVDRLSLIHISEPTRP